MTTSVDSHFATALEGLIEFGTHLPVGKKVPLELVVLKGHLLIERQLLRLIEATFAKPKAVDLARLHFNMVVRLAEALYGQAVPDWVWDETKQLNTIRNSLAHQLNDDTLEPRIQRFIASFKSRVGDDFKYVKGDPPEQMAYCLAYIHTELLKVHRS